MLEAVLFDMDGVLVDSREANVVLYQNVMRIGGYKTPSRDEILQCFHLPFIETVEHLTGSNDQVESERIRALLQVYPELRDPSLFVFPETVEDDLDVLSETYRLGVVTSRIHSGVETVFKARDISRFFEVIVAREDYSHRKPHPEPLYAALGKLGLGAEAAVYVGDSHTDVEAASAAGMRSIHLSASTHPQATLGIREFAEIVPAIQKLAD